MDARYLRNLGALTGEECMILSKKRVCVAGCGGLGGHLIELLARIGVGSIVVVDGDVFEITNRNRQLLATESTLGQNKARAAADRIGSINPNIDVTVVASFLGRENTPAIISKCDAVLDGLDSIAARKMLAAACAETGIPLIYGAIRGWVAQAGISMPGDGFVDQVYPAVTELKDKSVLSFTPALCAAMQMSLCTKLLLGRPVETGVLHYADLLEGEYETIRLLNQ